MNPSFDTPAQCENWAVILGGRDLYFFVREYGRWRAVADQFSPYP